MVKKVKDVQYYQAVGRRKESVARVRLHIASPKEKTVKVGEHSYETGSLIVNDKDFSVFFPLVADQQVILRPLELTGSRERFVVTIRTAGGGLQGQRAAIVNGVAKALCLVDPTFRPLLKTEDLLTRDSRIRERRMVGTGGKSRRQKQSPKR